MREPTIVESIPRYLSILEQREKNDILICRGQSHQYPLLPKIARRNPNEDTTSLERKMLEEFKRRGFSYIDNKISTDWELLVFAQHYNMATRLLDWSSNPLVALWFACENNDASYDSYVYVLFATDYDILSPLKESDLFNLQNTLIIKPTLNNHRIIAQQRWFTVHEYSIIQNRFIPLDENTSRNWSSRIACAQIPGKKKNSILIHLDTLGINYNSIYPDIEGIGKYINWLYI